MAKKKNQPRYPSVMLIDDNEIDNFINMKMIEGSGFAHNVLVHTGSRSALELLDNYARTEALPEEMIPGIIFLDINMPILNGFMFLEEFEKLKPAFRDKMKVIILTSSINPKDAEKSNKHPLISGFINKPLTEKHLGEL